MFPPSGCEPFLAAISEAPDDDAPRLVYADWLEERGGAANVARAEYIRLSCEAVQLLHGTPRRTELEIRCGELAKSFEAIWRSELPEALRADGPGVRVFYYRGFVENVFMPVRTALQALQGEWRSPLPDDWVLPLNDEDDESTVAALAATPRLAGLRRLTLGDRNSQRSESKLRLLLGAPYLHRLGELALIGEFSPASVASVLREVTTLGSLKEFRIVSDGGTDEVALAIANSPHFRNLDCLSISTNVGSRGAVAIAVAPHLATLRELWLSIMVGDLGAEAIAASPYLAELRKVQLGSSRITDRGALALLNSPSLAHLEKLDLPEEQLSEPVQAALLERFGEWDWPI